jgi:hypothetical protein
MYDEGLARFATEKYTNLDESRKDHFVHLTNYAINKENAKFIRNQDAGQDGFGSKWSLGALKRWLQERGYPLDVIQRGIKDLIIKSFLSVEEIIYNNFCAKVPYRSNCFELLGYDILLDTDLKPHLLEVNLCPSLECSSPMDLKIKASLISDLLNLAGVRMADQRSQCRSVAERFDRVMRSQPNVGLSKMGGKDPGHALSSDQIQFIIEETENEKARGGAFQLIYPCAESLIQYNKYFSGERPYNTALAR